LPLFNRKNWTRLRFGDIVENVNERVEPSTAEEEFMWGWMISIPAVCTVAFRNTGSAQKVAIGSPTQ